MAATKEEIRKASEQGKELEDVTHMIVYCNIETYTFEMVYVKKGDLNEQIKVLNGIKKVKVLEIYDYPMDLEQQLDEERAHNLEIKVTPKSSLETYIGTKIIQAEPQTCPKDSHNSKVGDPGYKVVYEDGYISWSPKEVFENAYRKTDGMTFGLAVEAMKMGLKAECPLWENDPDDISGIYSMMDEIFLFISIEKNKFTGRDLIVINTLHGMSMWNPTPEELLSDKWQIWEET